MKKYIFMAVAGMLALSSCSNDDNDVQNTQNAPRQMTFTAGFGAGATTRAALDGSTKKVSFDVNDGISILSAKNSNTDFYTTTGGASATFEGSAYDDSKFYAVYPFIYGLTLSGTTISGVLIPTSQNAASSTCGWDPTAPIAYATTTGTSLQFHNACALLKITNGRGLADIGVTCNEALTGIFSLDTSNGTLSGTGTSPVALAMSVPAGKTIYIAIAPGTKTNFRAVWNNGGSFADKMKSSFTFEKGKIYDLGNTSAWEEPEAVDLGLSVKWANMNVGASSEGDYGQFFAWGETTGYGSDTSDGHNFDWLYYSLCDGTKTTLNKYNNNGSNGTVDNKNTLEPADDAATANWGSNWRMPTYDELNELYATRSNANYTWTWTTVDGHNGWRITSNKSGTSGNSIFLPASGRRSDTSLNSQGTNGYYWSSSLYESNSRSGGYLNFDSGSPSMGYYSRFAGHSVRPVQNK